MIDEIINSLGLRISDLHRLVEDLNQDQMTTQPIRGMNHPTWNIGHIIYSFQAIGEEMGMAPWLPDSWIEFFGQGSKLVQNPSVYPSKEELLRALDEGRDRVVQKLRKMTKKELSGELLDVRYSHLFPTLGHAVMNTLVSHIAIHAGHISAWRQAMKLPKAEKTGT